LLLEDTLNDVQQHADGLHLRCVMLSSQIWAGKKKGTSTATGKVKWHTLARYWPAHLAAQLHGPVKTHLLGPDTDEVLAPLDADSAHRILQQLLTLYQQNLQQPLAAEVKTSCAYLTTDPDKAPLEAARSIYEGAYSVAGQVQTSKVLFRLWPRFADLLAGQLPDDETLLEPDANNHAFVAASTDLYADMVKHWHLHRQSPAADTEGAE
jgi:exodeoxyribonuclease V gamma subunit